MKKYIVTGGTGFIGSAIVKKLLREGHFVRVFDNNLRGSASKFESIQTQNLELVTGDIRDPNAVLQACKGMDSMVHLAYLNGTEHFYNHPDLVLDIGIKGMINVIDACKELNIREMIVASSSEVYQTPPVIPTDESAPLFIPDVLNPRYSYGGGKILTELMAINYGRKYFDKVIIFRPHNVIGPDMGTEHVIPQFALRMKELAKQSNAQHIDFPIQGSGTETRSFVYIDDFIEGLYLCMTKGAHLNIYHIGTEEEVSVKDAVLEVAKVFGQNVNIKPGTLQPGSTMRRCPNISKLRSLGYAPKYSFAEAIMHTASWYRDHDVVQKTIKI
ncbi:MAG: NAD-dependent epimerase/dehydratase family protein [Cytophagales bacterium]|nr:NAD-dependent epimerase/dehydratase family protein [Cytophagales bacterium]